MIETDLPVTKCPSCGEMLDAATGIDGKDTPAKPEDVSLCLNCGQPLLFNADLTLRAPTPADLANAETKAAIDRIKVMWLSTKIRAGGVGPSVKFPDGSVGIGLTDLEVFALKGLAHESEAHPIESPVDLPQHILRASVVVAGYRIWFGHMRARGFMERAMLVRAANKDAIVNEQGLPPLDFANICAGILGFTPEPKWEYGVFEHKDQKWGLITQPIPEPRRRSPADRATRIHRRRY